MNEDLFETLLKDDYPDTNMWVLGLLLLTMLEPSTKKEPSIVIYLGSDD